MLLFAGFAIAAYPRLHRKLLRDQSHRAAEAATAQIVPQLRDGDLIFHTSQSAQSRAIQLATHSAWSHCGIVYKQGENWQVFEAVQPVKLSRWPTGWRGARAATS
ncbi:YiiX/YebB-like N1pC/P60 family cysteine hydrolase [Hymenobacter sp. IS2118]|uniref:YiiX/YebB-like N1pC/P60 family cysteine hydrolase n=1 Tax=Hymenobacter sp. IS2118 TaxID=1505605 RepID=UPI00190F18A6|nr:YiiX/YebB-like N1pC/P60 family cysteine hydrolase [Hymenobacter sp. IS2118]